MDSGTKSVQEAGIDSTGALDGSGVGLDDELLLGEGDPLAAGEVDAGA
ncbi:MAG: hypothetical protein IT192_01285 [Microbacteriaceae bacterium]|nr:hypothetical protein [Microbacteriaceae bacterium]